MGLTTMMSLTLHCGCAPCKLSDAAEPMRAGRADAHGARTMCSRVPTTTTRTELGVTWVSDGPRRPTTAIGSSASGADSGSSCPSSGMRVTPRTQPWSLVQEMDTPDDITQSESARGRPAVCRRVSMSTVCSMPSKDRWAHAWAAQARCRRTPPRRPTDVQKEFHDLIGGDEPMGWDTQLPNEPVINIGIHGRRIWRRRDTWAGSAEWRVVPVGTVGRRELLHRRRSRRLRGNRLESRGRLRGCSAT